MTNKTITTFLQAADSFIPEYFEYVQIKSRESCTWMYPLGIHVKIRRLSMEIKGTIIAARRDFVKGHFVEDALYPECHII
jgi:hypothetical protein